MKLVIRFETTDELKDRLTELLQSFHKSEATAKEVIQKAKGEPAATPPATAEAAAPAGQPSETTSAATASPSDITVEDVRAIAKRLRDEGKDSAAVIKQFGSSLSAVPADKYPELIEALEAL